MSSDVTEIGSCSGCQRRAVLEDKACAACRGRFGQRCGFYMAKVRRDPEFARMCLGMLDTEELRKSFIDMFGDPGPRTRAC